MVRKLLPLILQEIVPYIQQEVKYGEEKRN